MKIKISKSNKLSKLAFIPVVVLVAVIGARYILFSLADSPTTVPGESYQLCTNSTEQSQYLTSPYTYEGLSSGIQTETVAQYQALISAGDSLPPLPSYISGESSSTVAAVLFAPGSNVGVDSWTYPNSPVIYFFEGGNYSTALGIGAVSGDEFIGGSGTSSGTYYPEPEFTDGGSIGSSNGSYDFSGGVSTLASAASVGSTTLTTTSAIGGYPSYVTFADKSTDSVSSVSGTTITLSSPLTNSEAEGATLVANRSQAINFLPGSEAQGATTISTGPTTIPIVPWEVFNLGASNGSLDYIQASQVSGSESAGYTLTLTQPLPASTAVNAPLYYFGNVSDGTIEYLNIGGGGGDDVFQLNGDNNTNVSGWTIEYNNIHDDYAGGSSYKTTSSAGQAIIGGDHATIEYNCFQRLGEYALNGGGTDTNFDYNQVDQTPYQPDLSGNGQSGGGKWWGSTNNDIVDDAFTDEGYSTAIWFDNGNTGMLVEGDYFYDINGSAIANETGYNSDFTGNLFKDVATAVNLNDSGGWNIPGSNYNNEILVENNTFYNVQTAVSIWGASGRSCLNSGEAESNGESSPYCSGGFPQIPSNDLDFSHYQDNITGNTATIAQSESCSTSSPCSTVTLSGPESPDDWIGFDGQAPDTCDSSPCGSGSNDPITTTTSSTTNVTTFTSSSPGTINVASTAGFPSSGHLLVNTSAGSLPTATGATLSYTGTTATSFTGVQLVTDSGANLGTGTLVSGGEVLAVQPYQVSAINCPGGNCTNNTVATVSPAITSNVTAGTAVYATGTCAYYDTAAATASAPLAPDGTSYIDGCMWEARNITVSNNTFYINASQFTAVNLPEGPSSGDWSCTVGSGGNCGQNSMGYQWPGGDAAPYNNVSFSNAMMSSSSLPAPLSNLNASGSPLITDTNGDVGSNSETPYNDHWTGNTYLGDWTFQAYVQAASCPVSWSGSALEWVGGTTGNACSGLSLFQWQTYWKQDTDSSYSATGSLTASSTTGSGTSGSPPTVSITSPAANAEIYSNNATTSAIDATATANDGGSIASVELLVNGTIVATDTSAPYDFNLDTLDYHDGTYPIGVLATDDQGNTSTASENVYISNGDLNGAGSVGIFDLTTLASHWGQTGTYQQGNITNNGPIGIYDLSALANNWGWSE